jgi:endonuclease YncB( thermonuclease family)
MTMNNFMKPRHILLLILATFIVLYAYTARPASSNKEPIVIAGEARVVDGDTIAINNQSIRLAHIDAPEVKQPCIRKDTHEVYNCGVESRDFLNELVNGRTVTCTNGKLDLYVRVLAECFIGNVSINRQMVVTGHAVLYKTAKIYSAEQADAKQNARGIWASDFELPWVWRKDRKLQRLAEKTVKTSEYCMRCQDDSSKQKQNTIN